MLDISPDTQRAMAALPIGQRTAAMATSLGFLQLVDIIALLEADTLEILLETFDASVKKAKEEQREQIALGKASEEADVLTHKSLACVRGLLEVALETRRNDLPLNV